MAWPYLVDVVHRHLVHRHFNEPFGGSKIRLLGETSLRGKA